jgi:hypothetical protein
MYWQRKLVHAQLGISSVSGRYLVQIAGGAKIKLPVLAVIHSTIFLLPSKLWGWQHRYLCRGPPQDHAPKTWFWNTSRLCTILTILDGNGQVILQSSWLAYSFSFLIRVSFRCGEWYAGYLRKSVGCSNSCVGYRLIRYKRYGALSY